MKEKPLPILRMVVQWKKEMQYLSLVRLKEEGSFVCGSVLLGPSFVQSRRMKMVQAGLVRTARGTRGSKSKQQE